MSEQDDFFDGVLDPKTKAGGSGTKFKPGIYPAIRIDKLLVKNGYHGLRFILEGTVVAEGNERDEGVKPTAIGAQGSWTPQIDGKNADIGLGEVMEFVGLLNGLTVEETNEDRPRIKKLMAEAISTAQPYTGRVFACEAWKHKTSNGYTMDKCKWSESEQHGTAPAPEAPTAEPEGGPWYPIANDARGTFYNAAGAFSTH